MHAMPLVSWAPLLLVFRLPSAQAPTSCGETPISPLGSCLSLAVSACTRCASWSEQERNRFLNQVQANPTFEGVERLQEAPSASDLWWRRRQQCPSPQLPLLLKRWAWTSWTRWPLRTCRCPLQMRKRYTRLWSRRRLHRRPLQLLPRFVQGETGTTAPPKLWPKQGASSSAGTPKVPAMDKAKPASAKTAEPKVIAKEKARPPPLVPEETEIQEEPPLPAPAAPPTEPTPPKTSFPPKRLRHRFHP